MLVLEVLSSSDKMNPNKLYLFKQNIIYIKSLRNPFYHYALT